MSVQAVSDEGLAWQWGSELDGGAEALIARYEPMIRRMARRMVRDGDQVDDVVQEIFLRMVVALPSFEGRSAIGTWIYRLAHNTCVDVFRRTTREARRRVWPPLDGQGPDDQLALLPARWGDPETELDHRIEGCYLEWVLSQLPADYCEIVRLRLGAGWSSEEVARLLGTSVDSVKAKLRRARNQLREGLAAGRRCPYCERLGPPPITIAERVA